ncbi:MAG: GNAT family N-acetyltransferase [Gemmatimonadetes bacterium]|nr:GNAT family N-acetyltransferase [Gemmatimonadota bacterium]
MSTVRVATAEDVERLEEACLCEGAARGQEQLDRFLVEQQAGLRLFLVAHRDTAVAGYLTLSWDADYPPFRRAGIPEIHDLYVLPSARRAGIATALLDAVEQHAVQRSGYLGLAVGLYADYGPAQRLYARRGYLPDGTGATSGGRPLLGGETISVDDGLVLHLVKALRA